MSDKKEVVNNFLSRLRILFWPNAMQKDWFSVQKIN